MSADSIKWIHCNRCFTFLTEKKTKLFLTTCEHVLCKSCIVQDTVAKKLKCSICSDCVNVVPIDREMPEKYKIYFHPKPWEKTRNWMSIFEFQTKQRDRIPRFLVKSELANDDKVIADKKNEIRKLIKERDEYRRKTAELMTYYQQYKEKYKQLRAQDSRNTTMEMDSGIGDSFISPRRSYEECNTHTK